MTPVVLTIAGSDSGGGAGIQADLKTMAALGTFGTSAITAITAQDTCRVHRVDVLPTDAVRAQIRAVLQDFTVAAVKIGMLATAEIARAVTEELADYSGPIVLDPVMVATSGDRLLTPDAEAMIRTLMLRCALVTPNVPEAVVLAGTADDSTILQWAQTSTIPILLTGGDATGDDVVDRLLGGGHHHEWRSPRIAGGPFHGTGCTLSSAIACGLAKGIPLVDATDNAIAWLRKQITAAETL
ncbi:MAG: hydroxymethylpyrimidine/phosphomethylpyrimidine kinase, partial [Myxococcota bacterium]